MSEQQPEKKHLPTGEEPPKGYETIEFDKVEDNEPRVDFVMLSHLARSEHATINALRSKALETVRKYIGLSNEPLSIEQEVNIIKDVDDSNKMFALVYVNKRLVGYSLVVIGWPEPGNWLIQHMIIDPDMRGKGIGTAIVKNIERYAQESEVAADAIIAVPIQESGIKFWQDNGYTVEAARFHFEHAQIDHEVVMYRKAFQAF